MKRHTLLFAIITASPLLSNLVLFFGMIIEGDLLIFTSGFLIHRGILSPFYTFAMLFLGTLFGDSLWYWLGRMDTTKYRFLDWLGRMTDRVGHHFDAHIEDRTFRTLFISKFVYGAHHFVLVRAGRRRVDFVKFLRNDLPATFLWIAIVGTAGYLASASFDNLRHHFKFAELALLVAIVLYFLINELIGKTLKKKLEEE